MKTLLNLQYITDGKIDLPISPGALSPVTKDQELQFLKNQAQALGQQLRQINKRIKELEEKK